MLGALGQHFTLNEDLQNLLLVQGWVPHHVQFLMDPPSWSLSCEAAFYLAFPLLWLGLNRLGGRGRWAVVALWFAAGATTFTFLATGNLDEVALYSSPFLRGAEFALGVLLALEFRRGLRLRHGWAVAFAVVAAAAIIDLRITGLARPGWLLALPFAAVILWVASNPGSLAARFLARRENVYLGELSFGFYLVHQLVLQPLLPHSPVVGLLHGVLLAAAGLIAALVGAILLHHLIERPAQRRLAPPAQAAPSFEARLSGSENCRIVHRLCARQMPGCRSEHGRRISEREQPGSSQRQGYVRPLRRVQLLERPVLARMARPPGRRSGSR